MRKCQICGAKLNPLQAYACSSKCAYTYMSRRGGYASKETQWSRKQKVTLPKISICEDKMSAEIYSVRSTDTPEAYYFQKYDKHLEPQSRYLMTQRECSCPRGETGKICRHQKMLPAFLKYKHVNDGFMLNYNTGQWIEPPKFIAEAVEETLPPPEAQVLASPPASAQAVSGGGSTLGPSYKRKI